MPPKLPCTRRADVTTSHEEAARAGAHWNGSPRGRVKRSIARVAAHLARVPALASAFALALVVSSTIGGALAADADPRAQETRTARFAHDGNHVADRWFEGARGTESAADCRGCHRFESAGAGADGPESGPSFLSADQCFHCHLEGAVEVRGEARLVSAGLRVEGVDEASRNAWFRHTEHLGLECAECHLREGQLVRPVHVSLGYCESCHGGDEPFVHQPRLRHGADPVEQTIDAASMSARFNLGITKRWQSTEAGKAGGGESFRHSSHVPGFGTDELDASVCADCHGSLDGQGESAILTPPTFDVSGRDGSKACEECHRGLEFRVDAREPGESRTAGAFRHGTHASVDCGRCHVASPTPTAAAEFALFGGTEDLYGECRSCHESSGPGAEPPAHPASHGADAVGTCVECHDAAPGRAIGSPGFVARPRIATSAAVRAYEVSDFSHAHAVDEGDDCATCHRAGHAVDGAFEPRAFVHAEHFALDGAEDQTCTVCHGDLDAAVEGAPAATFPRDLGAEDCGQCHRGGSVREEVSGVGETRSVLRFRHDQHASASCVDCHRIDGPTIALHGGVADCTGCHSHGDPGRTPARDGLDRAEVGTCTACHAEGLPGGDGRFAIERLSVTVEDASGFEHPPRDTQQDCTECHRVWGKTADVGEAAAAWEDRRGEGWVVVEESTFVASATRAATAGDWTPSAGDVLPTPHKAEFADLRRAQAARLGADGDPGQVYEKVLPAEDRRRGPDGRAEVQGERCLPCHWNSVDRIDDVTVLFRLGPDANVRTRGVGILDAWGLGLPRVLRPGRILSGDLDE